jgi:hypothetical protein
MSSYPKPQNSTLNIDAKHTNIIVHPSGQKATNPLEMRRGMRRIDLQQGKLLVGPSSNPLR